MENKGVDTSKKKPRKMDTAGITNLVNSGYDPFTSWVDSPGSGSKKIRRRKNRSKPKN